MKPAITFEMANAWFDALATTHPKKEGAPPQTAFPVRAVRAMPTSTGLALRVIMDNGDHADIFLNAVVALSVMQAIKLCGADGGWLAGDEIIIAPTPQGVRRWRPQA